MLKPENRKIYLEELKPPIGYMLDAAIGTTFSLDLLSLLMLPLSFVFFDAEKREEVFNSPLAVLDALRKSSEKMGLFCQQGRIRIPPKDIKLFNYLEPIVHEVQPDSEGVFHPKIWVIRFVSGDKPTLYRFLCFSRNLTFDKSWDTVLRLEGLLESDMDTVFPDNYPLADFIRELPEITVNKVSEKVQDIINLIVDEIIRVRFQTPDLFSDQIKFIPSGIGKYNSIDLFGDFKRLLLISPFLSKELLKEIYSKGNGNVLISRCESLDKLNPEYLKDLSSKTDIYILDKEVERPEERDDEKEEGFKYIENISGLHTKLYIAEKGRDAEIYTGSANATNAAFLGSNVEFMVGLKGRKSKIGIDVLLNSEDKVSFSKLLYPYHIIDEIYEGESIESELEKKLEFSRKCLIQCKPSISVVENYDETYSLIIVTEKKLEIDEFDFKLYGKCYPITIAGKQGRDISSLFTGNPIIFSDLSIIALSSFTAFELQVEYKNKKSSLVFALNLPADGMPEDRNNKVLQSIISNSDRFIRYLLFLLADDSSPSLDILKLQKHIEGDTFEQDINTLPLLEELLRSYSRNPDKLKNIKKLVDDLVKTEEGKKILPNEFINIWQAFIGAGIGVEDSGEDN